MEADWDGVPVVLGDPVGVWDCVSLIVPDDVLVMGRDELSLLVEVWLGERVSVSAALTSVDVGERESVLVMWETVVVGDGVVVVFALTVVVEVAPTEWVAVNVSASLGEGLEVAVVRSVAVNSTEGVSELGPYVGVAVVLARRREVLTVDLVPLPLE